MAFPTDVAFSILAAKACRKSCRVAVLELPPSALFRSAKLLSRVVSAESELVADDGSADEVDSFWIRF
jgi:hypothetical protein